MLGEYSMEKVTEYNVGAVTVVKGQVLEHLVNVSSSIVEDGVNFQELLPNNRNKYIFGENFRKYTKKIVQTDEIADEILNIEQHLKILTLGSVDIFFLKKIKKITSTEFKYYECPFSMIETEDGDTYLFTYRDNPDTTYCVCSKEDQNYNQKYDCCGIDCDWDIPVITKIKMDGTVIKYIYQGEQNCLWD